MKLYTKKMTYSLLAIGLLAGSPVDAKKGKGAKIAAGAVGALSAPAESIVCKRMCRGYFVDDANKKKLTGVIKKGDIKVHLKGVGKSRTCHCKYKGGLGIDKKKDFNMPDAISNRISNHLAQVSKRADSKKCDQSKEMCLIKK